MNVYKSGDLGVQATNQRDDEFLESIANFDTVEDPEDFGGASVMTSEFKNCVTG